MVPRTDCENPNCAQAASSASTTLSCTGGSTSLVCGDGVTTGFAPGEDDGDTFKVCFCDGSARGGCKSLSDFGSNGPVIAVGKTPAPTTPPTANPTLSPTTSCERMLMVVDAHANGPDQYLFPLGPAGVALTDLSQSAKMSLIIELDESFGGSVEFTINDTQTGLSIPHVENSYPYALMGDDNVVGNLDYYGWRATVGEHALAIRIFTGKSRSGELLCARDVIFEVVASRDIPTSPPTSPPTPSVPTCDASAWPAVKRGRVCDKLAEPRGAAVCAAVIDFSQTEAATCSGYCTSLGLVCVDADDEKRNKCKVLQRTAAATTCSTVINAALGMDAICYCNAGLTFNPERAQRATAGDVSAKTGAPASGSETVATAVVVTGGVVFVVLASMITVVRRRTRNTQRMPAGAVDLEWDAETEL